MHVRPEYLIRLMFAMTVATICGATYSVTAHAQALVWATSIGGPGFDSISDVAVDDVGNSYVIGVYTGSALVGAGDPNEIALTSAGSVDILVASYDANGAVRWAWSAGGSEVDQGTTLTVDAGGHILTAGLFEGTATFGKNEPAETSLTSTGSRDIFVTRHSPDGTLQWATSAGGANSNDHVEAIGVDADGDIYLTGFFDGPATFGAGETTEVTLTPTGSFDCFVARYDRTGAFLWATTFGGSGFDVASGVDVDASGNVYTAGYFEDGATFGIGEANETELTGSGPDIFLARFGSDGQFHWVAQAGGEGRDTVTDIVVDAAGGIRITGNFAADVSFGEGQASATTLTSAGEGDIYVAAFDTSGGFHWAKRAGGSGDDSGTGVDADVEGNTVVTGDFSDTGTFGDGESNEQSVVAAGDTDVFVAWYNAQGELQEVRRGGGNSGGPGSVPERGTSIAMDADGASLVVGLFDGPATFGPGETNETVLVGFGETDGLHAKFDAVVSTGRETESRQRAGVELSVNYPNPFVDETVIEYRIGIATDIRLRIFDALGRRVRMLADGHRALGAYTAVFDRGDLPAGVYFVVLETGDAIIARKVIAV